MRKGPGSGPFFCSGLEKYQEIQGNNPVPKDNSHTLRALSQTCHEPSSSVVHRSDKMRLAPMKKALLILTAFFLTAAPLQPDTGAQFPQVAVGGAD